MAQRAGAGRGGRGTSVTPTGPTVEQTIEIERARLDFARAQQEVTYRIRRIDGLYSVARTAVRAAGWFACCYCLYLSIQALAGKATSAQLTAMANVGLDRWAAYALTGTMGFALWRERRLRRKTIEGGSQYIKQLEMTIDPKRSSSGLTSRGTPRREDADAL